MSVPPPPVDAVRSSHDRLLTVLAGLTEETARAPSPLPEWSRAHVAAHLANNARALTRMTRAGLEGQLVPMYDGGQEGRAADIEAVAVRLAPALLADVAESARQLEAVWAEVSGPDWDRPISIRDATLAYTVYSRWRESEIHAVDLGLGVDCTAWQPDFCVHAVQFLLQRLPVESGAAVVPDDDAHQWVVGAGDGPRVTGRLCDLTAWLAGREPVGPVRAGDGALPTLDPWPPRLARD
ncbi:MAG: maleylpyruvate isomerase family mycothiol-dependent enzyme [Actinomycetes bacterium]